MHYEINVFKDGQHFFATAERSLTTAGQTKEVFKEIDARFPASEGYKITVHKWETCGSQIDPTTLRG